MQTTLNLLEKPAIQDQFERFLESAPWVWELFKRQVFRAKDAGRKKVGAKAIIEWLRWEGRFNRLGTEDFKINNNYTSRFVRKFEEEFPYYPIEFETRVIKRQ